VLPSSYCVCWSAYTARQISEGCGDSRRFPATCQEWDEPQIRDWARVDHGRGIALGVRGVHRMVGGARESDVERT